MLKTTWFIIASIVSCSALQMNTKKLQRALRQDTQKESEMVSRTASMVPSSIDYNDGMWEEDNSIPNVIWVTGGWASDSDQIDQIDDNLNTHETMSMQDVAESAFAKWTPIGSRIRYFTDKDMTESALKISKMLEAKDVASGAFSAYSNLRPGAFRADLWRYMILWAHGGVYLDADLQLQAKLEEWVDFANDELVLVKDGNIAGGAYWNAMMAAAPQNVYLGKVIKAVVKNIHDHYYGNNPLEITGPIALHKALEGSDYKNHSRCELSRHGRSISSKKDKHSVVSEDTSLNGASGASPHYDSMWHNKEVYCDEPYPHPRDMCVRN